MAESLFTSQTPAVADASDSTAYTLGTKFSSSSVGSITHGRWFFPTTPTAAPVDFVLYDEVTEVELGRATFTGSGAGWRTVALPTPVAYPVPGTMLVAAVETPDRYVATLNFFSSTALTSGSLTSPADGDNGRLGVGFVYPSVSPSDTSYFADVVFSPAGIGTTLQAAASGSSTSIGAAAVTARRAAAAAGASGSVGSAAVVLRLAATAAGACTGAGAAAASIVGPAPVTWPATGSGASLSAGSAAVVLRLAATASGASASAGSAGVVLRLVAAGSGVSTSAGLAVATISGPPGQVVTRPFTGTTARPSTGTVARPFAGIVLRP